MKLPRALLLAAALLLAVSGLAWWKGMDALRAFVFSSPPREEIREGATDVASIQEQVSSSLPAVGLTEAEHLEENFLERNDRQGSWDVHETRWLLPPARDPQVTALRLRSLVEGLADDVRIYQVESETMAVDMRIYAGSRLACRLHLTPSLPPWPSLDRSQPAMLAVVLRSIDQAPHLARRSMELDLPLTFALSPYSPFTLRISRDAVLTHKEVLAQVEPDTTFLEALEAVPHASGLLLAQAPQGDPDSEAAHLAAEEVYLLDVSPEGLPSHWLRALHDAGVPHIRGLLDDPNSTEDIRHQFRHLAARTGSAVMVTDVDSSVAQELTAELEEAQTRSYRIAFAQECVRHHQAL